MSVAAPPRRVVCLGEALVDLVCRQPVASLVEAPGFEPRVGGSLANIAVVAARFGARVEFLGGAGDDDWGRWLRASLAAQGVDVSRFVLAPSANSSLAFVAVSPSGEPSFTFYGDSDRPAAHAGRDLELTVAGTPGILVLGGDTLISEREREVTLGAAELGRERGWTVLFDPNLRPLRWASEDEMLGETSRLVERARVVKCNLAEARALTGKVDEEQAARALLNRGPAVAIVTRGDRGALLAGPRGLTEVTAARSMPVVDATGAGDCVAGVLAAALAAGAAPATIERALALAMEVASRVVARWGASAGLPSASRARAQLGAALRRGSETA